VELNTVRRSGRPANAQPDDTKRDSTNTPAGGRGPVSVGARGAASRFASGKTRAGISGRAPGEMFSGHFRAGTRPTRPGGVGLGLFIVKAGATTSRAPNRDFAPRPAWIVIHVITGFAFAPSGTDESARVSF